ncbi:MAG: hypothetical protein C5B57_01050, partial [Blastocatellia bacterium]
HFYVIGSVVRDGSWRELYDANAQWTRASAIAPTSTETFFVPVESPQLALLFAPFTRTEYTTALAIWLVVVVILYAGSYTLLWPDAQALRAYTGTALVTSVAFPGLFNLVLHGQTSAISLIALATAAFALRRGRLFAAGIAVGMLVFKPHWMLAAVGVFLIAGEWRLVAGAMLGAGSQLALTWLYVGSSVMRTYWRALQLLSSIADLLEPKPSDSLEGLFRVLVSDARIAVALYLIAGVAIAITAARIWRSRAAFDVRFSAVVLAIVLTSPHTGTYDLIMLGPVFLLLANWLVQCEQRRWVSRLVPLLAAAFVAPLLTGTPALVRLQMSVSATIAVLMVLRWICDSEHSRAGSPGFAEGSLGGVQPMA